jgi:uncharacterized protein YndB with AHSA1/START domain
MKESVEPIVVEQTFNAPIDTVWNSITQIDLMRRWFFENIPDFRPEVGFETQFKVATRDRTIVRGGSSFTATPTKKKDPTQIIDNTAISPHSIAPIT